MTPIYPDLRKVTAISVVLCVLLYTGIALLFGISTSRMLLKIGSIIALVGLFWIYFEKYGWRKKLFRLGGWLTDMPDLNGRWEGTVDRLGENDPHVFVLEIRQTYLRTQLHAYTKNSRGSSITTQFVTDHVHGRYSLISTWQCRTKNRSNPNEIDEFLGTSIYEIIQSGEDRYLEDYYFTRRKPQTKGKTRLKFVGKEFRDGV
jgi:hypothetical protein